MSTHGHQRKEEDRLSPIEHECVGHTLRASERASESAGRHSRHLSHLDVERRSVHQEFRFGHQRPRGFFASLCLSARQNGV